MYLEGLKEKEHGKMWIQPRNLFPYLKHEMQRTTEFNPELFESIPEPHAIIIKNTL